MRWRIRRIVNGCAVQQLVACRDVIAPEFISYGLVMPAEPQRRERQTTLWESDGRIVPSGVLTRHVRRSWVMPVEGRRPS